MPGELPSGYTLKSIIKSGHVVVIGSISCASLCVGGIANCFIDSTHIVNGVNDNSPTMNTLVSGQLEGRLFGSCHVAESPEQP